MIDRIEIKGFKNILEADLALRPLTVFTGLNSTGKSTVLQSVLTVCRISGARHALLTPDVTTSFQVIRNRFANSRVTRIGVSGVDSEGSPFKTVVCVDDDGEREESLCGNGPSYERNLFYLNANRSGGSEISQIYSDIVSGKYGDALMGTFQKEKAMPVEEGLARDTDSLTLSSQVDWWLSHILGMELRLFTHADGGSTVSTSYSASGLSDISPLHLGAGVSYLAKILILCLRARKGDVVMIENPAIHLHPAAQSRLAEFMAFVARSGIQLLIETHSDNFLTRLRYEVMCGSLKSGDVIVYYKEGVEDAYDALEIDEYGKFNPPFPAGFFDATLHELIELD